MGTFERIWNGAVRCDRSKRRFFPYIMVIMRDILLEQGVRPERVLLAFGLHERANLLASDLFVGYEALTGPRLSEQKADLELDFAVEEFQHRWRTALRQMVNFARRSAGQVMPVEQG